MASVGDVGLRFFIQNQRKLKFVHFELFFTEICEVRDRDSELSTAMLNKHHSESESENENIILISHSHFGIIIIILTLEMRRPESK